MFFFLKSSHYLIREYGFLSDKVGFSEKPTLSADNVVFLEKNPGLSERNPHYLRAQMMRVHLFISVRIFAMPAHLLIKEHPCSQDCIGISDNLKIRLEKLNYLRTQTKERFQISLHYLRVQIMWVSLR